MVDEMHDARAGTNILACPRCGETFTDATRLRCTTCAIDYPAVADIPWLFADPAGALAEWRARVDYAQARLRRDGELVAHALAGSVDTNARQRLTRLARGYDAQLRALTALLLPLDSQPVSAALEVHLALKARLPIAQGLTSYYPNLFRDWCWGDEENRASCEAVFAAMGPQTSERLVLGAGACRLAYDLHRASTGGRTHALDFNPLLLLAAERVLRGGSVELVEFPIAPRTLEDVAVTRRLEAPAVVDARFRTVLADADRPPFRPAAFDCVITPWFVDVADEPLPELARRINALLCDGGRWIVFGSLAFEHADPARRYSKAEVDQHIEAAGLRIVHDDEREIPYMNAPGSRHARREVVATIAAEKTAAVAVPRFRVALPSWLVDPSLAVPLSPAFRTQAFTTRIYAYLMSLIDGRRSIDDIAGLMEKQKLMPKAEALASIRSFLTKMFEEGQAPPGR